VLAGVVNTMLYVVYERRREIGTLMSVGFRRRAILVLFLCESLWLARWRPALGWRWKRRGCWSRGRPEIGFAIPAGATVRVFPVLRLEHVAGGGGRALAGAVLAG